MPATRLTHLSQRRRSSIPSLSSLPKYNKHKPYAPAPARISFYPNVTPTTYVSQEQKDAELDYLATQMQLPTSGLELMPFGASSSSSSTTPEPESKTEVVGPVLFPPSTEPKAAPTRKRQPPGKRRSQGYIPRPPNAFMLFRADFVKQKHVPGSIETNHGSLSKIIGQCWRSLPPHEKRIWEIKARAEKQAHKEKYPDYKFKPVHKKRRKAAVEAEDDEDDFDSDADYADAAPSKPAPSKKPKTTRATSATTTSKHKPPILLTLDNASPSTYSPSSARHAFVLLREERQTYIIACLTSGVKKRESSNGACESVPMGEGEWLEDYVERWERERLYGTARVEAETEEKEERDREQIERNANALPYSFAPKAEEAKPILQLAPASMMGEERGRRKSWKDIRGHRRSSSVPLPEGHGGYNPYAMGYYPQHQGQYGYDSNFSYPQYPMQQQQQQQQDAYGPYTNSNWGTQMLPLDSSNIQLPTIPPFSSLPPSPSPSASSGASVPISGSGMYSQRPSLSYYNGYNNLTGHRMSIGMGLGHRRASSAQPCLSSQYAAVHAEFGFPQHGVWEQQQHTQEVDMPFDPTAVSEFGEFNANFSFSSNNNNMSTPSLSSGTSDVGEADTGLYNSSFGIAQSAEVPPLAPEQHGHVLGHGHEKVQTQVQAQVPFEGYNMGVDMGMGNHNLQCTTTFQQTYDPLDPSPISAGASSVSSVETETWQHPMHSGQVVHAPQPVTPIQAIQPEEGMELAMDIDVEAPLPIPSPTPRATSIPQGTPEIEPTPNPEPQINIDSAKVFTDLWQGLSSSQSFCMGSAFRMSMSVPEGASMSVEDAARKSVTPALSVDEEEEDGEFERALRREHDKLVGC